MRFTCEKSMLVAGLNIAGRTVAQKSSLSVLEGILCKASDSLYLTRILPAIPQMGVLDAEIGIGATFVGADDFSVTVHKAVADDLAFLAIGDEYFRSDLGIGTFHNRRDLDAGSTVVVQIEVGFGNANQIHITVQTTIEGAVSHLGIDIVVGCIVHQNGQQIFLLQVFGQIHTPGRETAIVTLHVLSVQINVSRGCGAGDFQIIPVSLGQIGLV